MTSPDRGARGFEPDRPKTRAGPAGVRRLSRLYRRARRAARARGSRAPRLPDLRPHDHAAALADHARWRAGQRPDPIPSSARTAATFCARRPCPGGAWRSYRRFLSGATSNRRTSHGPRPLSAARARNSCALRVEPLPCRQDPRVRRFPRRAVRRRAGMGPVSRRSA